MVVPEATLARLAEIVPQFLDAENLAGFLLDGLGPVFPDDFEDFPNPSHDVVGMVGVGLLVNVSIGGFALMASLLTVGVTFGLSVARRIWRQMTPDGWAVVEP